MIIHEEGIDRVVLNNVLFESKRNEKYQLYNHSKCEISLEPFQFRWLSINGFDTAFPIYTARRM